MRRSSFFRPRLCATSAFWVWGVLVRNIGPVCLWTLSGLTIGRVCNLLEASIVALPLLNGATSGKATWDLRGIVFVFLYTPEYFLGVSCKEILTCGVFRVIVPFFVLPATLIASV